MSTKYLFHRFDSLTDFVKAAEERRDKNYASSRTGGYDAEWAGTESFEEAAEYATRGGWEPEMATEFRNMFDELLPNLRKFTEFAYEPRPDVTGYEVNMQAFLDGEPDNMFQWVPTEHQVTKRALCMLIGHSISAGVSSEELFLKGQAVVGLVRALQLLGYELEIWSEQTVQGSKSDESFTILTRLHAAGEVMDQSAVEFAVGNPSWLRRLIFGYEEGESPVVRKRYGFGPGGYGSPRPVQHANMVNADVTVALGSTWMRGDDPVKAGYRWIVDQLKEFGAIPEDAEV